MSAGRHEMPGRAQHVGAQDRAAVERLLDAGVAAGRRRAARPPTWRPGNPAPGPRPGRRRRPRARAAAAAQSRWLRRRRSTRSAKLRRRRGGTARRWSGTSRGSVGRSWRRPRARSLLDSPGSGRRSDRRRDRECPSRLSPLARWVQRGGVGRRGESRDRRARRRRREAADAALTERLRRGDATAFDEVYRRYTPGLFAFLARLVGRAAIAEELLQETWMRLATHARALARDTNLRAWLYHGGAQSIPQPPTARRARSGSPALLAVGVARSIRPAVAARSGCDVRGRAPAGSRAGRRCRSRSARSCCWWPSRASHRRRPRRCCTCVRRRRASGSVARARRSRRRSRPLRRCARQKKERRHESSAKR